MGLESVKFKESGVVVQVGGLNTTMSETVEAENPTTAKAASHVVQVQDVSGLGCWFLIGDDGEALAPAEDTGAYLPAFGITRPFVLKAGKVIEATGKINLQFVDVEE